jgi:polysaccharide biosynthesis protein PslH
MKILWLKSDLLLPLDKGGKLRSWHLMRHLAMAHEITYLSFFDPDLNSPSDVRGMSEVAQRVEVIPRREPRKRSLGFYAQAAWHLLDPQPYAVGKYRSRAFRDRLQQLLAQEAFDLVVSDFLPPIVNMPSCLGCPSVLFTHNVEAEIWRRHAEVATGAVARRLLRVQHARMLRFERHALERFDGVLAVSDQDRDTFARLYGDTLKRPAHVVPTGVDTEYFSPAPGPTPDTPSLVFTGSMDWLPNEDAIVFFCQTILPLIRRDLPDVQLSVVGRAPTPMVRKLAEESGIRVTGRVDDVRPYMRDAAVYVVPLRIGGGTRLKIFEAMAMGKAVVSTTVGAEGLPVRHGEHLLLADDPDAFAQSVVRLFHERSTRERIGTAARALVAERYDWGAAARVMEAGLIECVTRTRSRSAGVRETSPHREVAAHRA